MNIGNTDQTLASAPKQTPRFHAPDGREASIPDPDDVAHFVTYASALLDQLEGMARELFLDELASSLNLCKNVAQLSAESRRKAKTASA